MPPRSDLIPGPLLIPPGKLIGCSGRGTGAANLRAAVMRLGQCRGEGDAAAGDLSTRCVRQRERRGDCD